MSNYYKIKSYAKNLTSEKNGLIRKKKNSNTLNI